MCGDHFELCTHICYVFKNRTNVEDGVFRVCVLVLCPYLTPIDAVRADPSQCCFFLCCFCVVVAFFFFFFSSILKISIESVGWPVLLLFLL